MASPVVLAASAKHTATVIVHPTGYLFSNGIFFAVNILTRIRRYGVHR